MKHPMNDSIRGRHQVVLRKPLGLGCGGAVMTPFHRWPLRPERPGWEPALLCAVAPSGPWGSHMESRWGQPALVRRGPETDDFIVI